MARRRLQVGEKQRCKKQDNETNKEKHTMKIELKLGIIPSGRARADVGRTFVAESLSLLPIPVPAIGDHLQLEAEGKIYCGLVIHREFDLVGIDDTRDGVLRIKVSANQTQEPV